MLALAEMFETQNYFGMTHTNHSRVNDLDGDTRPSKWRRIATPDPGLSLVQPPPQTGPNFDDPLSSDTSAINTNEVLTNHWVGHDNGGDSDDDIDFEGHPIPQLVEVSDNEDEESELDLEDLLALGAEGVLPGRYIVSLLRVFKQFTHPIPSGQMLSSFKTYSLSGPTV
jgi:hypothetical protein